MTYNWQQKGWPKADMLAKRGRGVKIELVTHSNGELAESDFEAFAKQCGKFTKTICGICHDRFSSSLTARKWFGLVA